MEGPLEGPKEGTMEGCMEGPNEGPTIHGRNKQESCSEEIKGPHLPGPQKETESLSQPLFSKSAHLLAPVAQRFVC